MRDAWHVNGTTCGQMDLDVLCRRTMPLLKTPFSYKELLSYSSFSFCHFNNQSKSLEKLGFEQNKTFKIQLKRSLLFLKRRRLNLSCCSYSCSEHVFKSKGRVTRKNMKIKKKIKNQEKISRNS